MKWSSLKTRAQTLKQHTLTVYFLARDSRTPVWVRLLAFGVAAYALSPIDLIPDFIPVIGYLDDIVLIPLGIALILRFTPPAITESCRCQAEQAARLPVNYPAAVCITAIWLFLLFILLRLVAAAWQGGTL